MKIALLGYGKMGQMVEKAAQKRGHVILTKITSPNWKKEELEAADLCIDFTRPECAIENLRKAAEAKTSIVIGTTGWYDEIDEAKKIVNHYQIAALYGPNFSTGIHIWLQILAKASELVNQFEGYEIAGYEEHHSKKLDTPSGTALEMAKVAETQINRLHNLPISSLRCGFIPGTHSLIFDSPYDTISITHKARNRAGFAEGAIDAAEWLVDKQGFYTFNEFMQAVLQNQAFKEAS